VGRAVGRAAARLREAARQGFRRCLMPAGSLRGLGGVADVDAEGVASVDDLLRRLELA
jgi:predicted ATP-dependent serine protease